MEKPKFDYRSTFTNLNIIVITFLSLILTNII